MCTFSIYPSSIPSLYFYYRFQPEYSHPNPSVKCISIFFHMPVRINVCEFPYDRIFPHIRKIFHSEPFPPYTAYHQQFLAFRAPFHKFTGLTTTTGSHIINLLKEQYSAPPLFCYIADQKINSAKLRYAVLRVSINFESNTRIMIFARVRKQYNHLFKYRSLIT